MSRPTLILGAGIAIAGLLTLFWLQSHSVDLIYSVVLSATLQKLPEDYSPDAVEAVFTQTRRLAIDRNQEERFLKALVLVSQRLEKRQRLRAWEVDSALELLRGFEELD